MLTYGTIQELVEKSSSAGRKISEIVMEDQTTQMEITFQELFTRMQNNFTIMRESVHEGMNLTDRLALSPSGDWAARLKNRSDAGESVGGRFFSSMLAKALAVSQCNSRMGRIVAAPTAGSCGILPAVLVTALEERQLSEEEVVKSLFTAAAIGMVIANKATISGAEGGCQAECGSAAAMAAAALVELLGGSPAQAADACAISLKNTLGLVCDPVAGLVEIPCIKRNAMGAANALVAAELALAGIESVIPADEVIDAMREVGAALPGSLKETAKGGLADTPTGRRLAEQIHK